MRIVGSEAPGSLDANASAAVGMIYKDEFAAVGVGFFERRKFSGFGSERGVGCCWVCEEKIGEAERGESLQRFEIPKRTFRSCASSREATPAFSCGYQPAEPE
ncbi:MAG: hypothetical protein AAF585_03555 [Verrucomicrobiota bacterium]